MPTAQLVPTPEDLENFTKVRNRLDSEGRLEFDKFISTLGELVLSGAAVMVGDGNITDNSSQANATAMNEGISGSIIFGDVKVLTDDEFDREPVDQFVDTEEKPQPNTEQTIVKNSFLFGKTNIFRSVIECSSVADSSIANSVVKSSEIQLSKVLAGSFVRGSNISESGLANSRIEELSTVDNSTVVNSDVRNSQVEKESIIKKSKISSAHVTNSTIENNSNAYDIEVIDSSLDGTKAKGYSVKEHDKHTDQIVDSKLSNTTVELSKLANVEAINTVIKSSFVNNLDFEYATLNKVNARGLKRTGIPKPTITGRHVDEDISTSHSAGQPYQTVHI